jgi:drug/metabolite transporter (DMT)-like permease
LIKGALQFTSIDELLTLRFFISLLVTLKILFSTLKKFKLISTVNLVVFAIIIISVFFSQAYAIDDVPATFYVSIFTLVPIVFLLICREPLNKVAMTGSGLAITGMIVFIFSLQYKGHLSFWSIILVILSMFTWVAYSLFTKKIQNSFLDKEIVAITTLIGFLSSLSVWFLHGFHIQNLSLLGLELCCLAGIVLPLALVAYSFSLRHKPVFAIFSQYLEPIFGLIIAVIFLGEKMNVSQLLAAFIIVSGTFLVGIATRKQRP